jgi:hypothetical protein
MIKIIVPIPPSGLIVHCANCNIVVPADAPRSTDSDCAFVALHRLTWFNPNETVAGQHVMAVAAWGLIHDAALKAAHPEATAYYRRFQLQRKAHFAESAARKAMTPEQVEAGKAHRRDGALFA